MSARITYRTTVQAAVAFVCLSRQNVDCLPPSAGMDRHDTCAIRVSPSGAAAGRGELACDQHHALVLQLSVGCSSATNSLSDDWSWNKRETGARRVCVVNANLRSAARTDIYRRTDGQTGGQIDGQTDRQTGRQTAELSVREYQVHKGGMSTEQATHSSMLTGPLLKPSSQQAKLLAPESPGSAGSTDRSAWVADNKAALKTTPPAACQERQTHIAATSYDTACIKIVRPSKHPQIRITYAHRSGAVARVQ